MIIAASVVTLADGSLRKSYVQIAGAGMCIVQHAVTQPRPARPLLQTRMADHSHCITP